MVWAQRLFIHIAYWRECNILEGLQINHASSLRAIELEFRPV